MKKTNLLNEENANKNNYDKYGGRTIGLFPVPISEPDEAKAQMIDPRVFRVATSAVETSAGHQIGSC